VDDEDKDEKSVPEEGANTNKFNKSSLKIRSLEERFAEDQGYGLFKPGCVREYGLREILYDLQASSAPRWRLRALLIRWYERK
jgi:hypothetical protein